MQFGACEFAHWLQNLYKNGMLLNSLAGQLDYMSIYLHFATVQTLLLATSLELTYWQQTKATWSVFTAISFQLTSGRHDQENKLLHQQSGVQQHSKFIWSLLHLTFALRPKETFVFNLALGTINSTAKRMELGGVILVNVNLRL